MPSPSFLEETKPISLKEETSPKTAEKKVARNYGKAFMDAIHDSMQTILQHARSQFQKRKNKKKKSGHEKEKGPFPLALIWVLLGLLLLFVGFSVFLLIQYYTIAATLPNIDDLKSKASQFETTRIYDRNGNPIYEILDPNAGFRTYVPLKNISPYVTAATIATEDKDFYKNPGFDFFGIMRALWQNYTSGTIVSGASTITQQLARTLLLSPEERSQQTVQRKAKEIWR